MSAYIDGEVLGRQGEALETHLGHCASCHEELETLRSALALLSAPRTPVRPEGLLEEFKAKYLPEAEAAPAPRWGIRLPVMPRFEWPSLGRVMVPMGGMAAAAAALLVALHNQPVVVGHGPTASGPTARQLAALPAPTETRSGAATEAPAVGTTQTAQPRVESVAKPATVTVREPTRPRFSEHQGMTVPRLVHRRLRHRALAFAAAAPHPAHHKKVRSSEYRLATRTPLAPPVSVDSLKQSLRRHEDAVPTPEMQWQDQVVVIQRKATASATEDGYAEASSKDLATGVIKSVAIGAPPEPAAAVPGPVAGDSGGGK